MRQTRQYYDAPLTSAAPEVVGWETEQRYFSGTSEIVPSVGGDAVEVEPQKDQQALLDAAARYRAALLAT